METMAVTFLKKLPRILIWLCLISLFFAINYVIIDSYNSFQGNPTQSKTSGMHISKTVAYSNASTKLKKNNLVNHDKIKDKQAGTKKKESQESKLHKSKPKKSEYADKLLKLTNKTPRKIIDIMGLPPIKFDQRYKNPCFIGDVNNPLFQDGRLHCLPYFYIIGVKKSGTSDFFNRIAAHPEFQTPSFKEAQWFPRLRAGIDTKFITERSDFKNTIQKGIDNRSIKFYISMFDSAADGIQNCTRRRVTTNKCIT
ncbi:uncharacterized protein LOC132722643, partial [Ruditapes philippinarum]|uniref:uncharacterized protein LOC132722643 n=1 Tax=Ruditapes philippinarum TaxID=129788 RepID=UPI00295BE997